MEFIRKKFLLIILFAGILYLAFSVYTDFEQLITSFRNFNFLLLPLILFLSLLNYLVRFYKWSYYLRLINIKLVLRDSVIIFLSGFLMSITPIKLGELFKSYLIKRIDGTPISKTAPVVFAERITDFLSLAFLALIGSFIFDYGLFISLLMTLFLLFIIILITNKKIFKLFLKFISGISFLRQRISKFNQLFESTELLLRIKPLSFAIIISIFSWGFECLGYYLVITNFSKEITFLWAVFSYSFSTIVGAISMLPGGLGITEGSFLVMLNNFGLKLSDSTAITFITRVSTLWFAVFIGMISFMIYSYKFGKIDIKVDNSLE